MLCPRPSFSSINQVKLNCVAICLFRLIVLQISFQFTFIYRNCYLRCICICLKDTSISIFACFCDIKYGRISNNRLIGANNFNSTSYLLIYTNCSTISISITYNNISTFRRCRIYCYSIRCVIRNIFQFTTKCGSICYI